MAAISTALITLLKSGDEILLLQRDLRRHLSHHRRSAAEAWHRASFHLHRRARGSSDRSSARKTKIVWFESPINPTLRCVDVRSDRGGVQEGRRAGGDGQHLRQPDQSAGAVDGHRPVDAELHEVPERPQRRHRRRAVGIAGADGADGEDAAPARRHHGSAAGVRARTRHEDHAASRRAAQRQRA